MAETETIIDVHPTPTPKWPNTLARLNAGKTPCPRRPFWRVWRGRHRWVDAEPHIDVGWPSFTVVCRDCGWVGIQMVDY